MGKRVNPAATAEEERAAQRFFSATNSASMNPEEKKIADNLTNVVIGMANHKDPLTANIGRVASSSILHMFTPGLGSGKDQIQGAATKSTTTTTTNAAPATEDISVRRDNFRKSLFKTPSGGDMNASMVRRKSLLGE